MNTTAHAPQRRISPRALVSWAVFVLALAAWWAFLAPTAVGGHTVYVLVNGHSMEPMLHTGDLALVRTQDAYAVGDLVLMQVDGGQVIHRLIGGTSSTVWETKGDNNGWVDPWTVPNADIVGAYAVEVPQFGTALTWLRQNPLPFGLMCGVFALIAYVPWHRRRIAPVLAATLARAQREPRREGRSGAEYGVLAISAVGTLVSLAMAGRLMASHMLASVAGGVALVAVLWAGTTTVVMLYRLYDGRGVAEPTRSVQALSGRLYRVEEFPELYEPAELMDSAVALRAIAERYRLPVLHRIDPQTGEHEFLLITQGHGQYYWSAMPVSPPAEAAPDPPPRTERRGHRHVWA